MRRILTAAVMTAVALVPAVVDTPVRGAFTALLLLGAPGLAAAYAFRATTWEARLAVALAATVIVNVAVAQVMVLAGAWSPRGGVVAVALVSGCLLAYGLSREPPSATPFVGAGPPGRPVVSHVEVVQPTELGDAELERWRSMQGRVAHLHNPFLAPEFVQAVGRFHDRARVAVLSDGPEIVGFFPFDRHRFGIARPIAAGLTDCQGLVHVPELDLDARALLRDCGLSVFEFDHLVDGQPFFAAYETARAASPVIDISDGYEAYKAYLRASSAKFWKTTMRKQRKLEREVGVLRYEHDVSDPDALRQLTSWKSDQYRRTGRADRFAQRWIVALVEHLFGANGSDSFAGELSMLYVDDRPIAGHFGLRNEDVLVGWFPAYDTRFAKYSPGLIHHLAMAEAAAAAGIRYIDMGRGQREYKDAMKTRELAVVEGRVLGASPAASAYWAVRAPSRALRNFVVARPELFRLADRALKRYGRMTRVARKPLVGDDARAGGSP